MTQHDPTSGVILLLCLLKFDAYFSRSSGIFENKPM